MYSRRKLKKYRFLAVAGLTLTLLAIIPLRLAIATTQTPHPQAFLTLGGDPPREQYTAELAKWYPSLEVWVSSPPQPEKTYALFQAANIATRLHIDNRASDTVTNFTTLVSDFKKRQIQHLYLITSKNHMPRAKAIAFFVLGSQGIAFTPLSVPSDQPQESVIRILRDIARSLLWMITGYTGANL